MHETVVKQQTAMDIDRFMHYKHL